MRLRPRLTLALLLAFAAAPAAGSARPAAPAAITVAELTLARMAVPFIGGTAPPLTAADRHEIDVMGNRNGVYDIGDIRILMYFHPELIPAGVVHTSAAPAAGRP